MTQKQPEVFALTKNNYCENSIAKLLHPSKPPHRLYWCPARIGTTGRRVVINVEYIREFVVLARYLNFTTAARELFLSQPTLSKHMTALESQLGASLITRKPTVELTATGTVFYEQALALLQDLDERLEAIQSFCTSPNKMPSLVKTPDYTQLVFGYEDLCRAARDIIASSGTARPFKLVELNRRSLKDNLIEGIFDWGIVFLSHKSEPRSCEISDLPASRMRFLSTQSYHILTSRNHPLASLDSIGHEALAPYHFEVKDIPLYESFRTAIQDSFASEGIVVRPRTTPNLASSDYAQDRDRELGTGFGFIDPRLSNPSVPNERGGLVVRRLRPPLLLDAYLVYLPALIGEGKSALIEQALDACRPSEAGETLERP